MMSLSNTEQRMSVSSESRREQLETSLVLNPRFVPQKPTAVLGFFKITVRVMFLHLPTGVMTRDIKVEGGSP